MAKVVLGNRTAFDYLLVGQGDVYAMANTTGCPCVVTFGEAETPLYKITEQASWLKKVTCTKGSSFDLFDCDWFGS